MTDKEQIMCKYKFQDKMRFDGRPYCTCFSKLCEDLSFICEYNCQIYEDYKQLARKTQEYNNLANILHATTIYPEICDRCKDEILIYPMISGKTSYTDHEVDLETLIAIVDRLKYKTQECEELKTEKCNLAKSQSTIRRCNNGGWTLPQGS